jgi:hypothetical protein
MRLEEKGSVDNPKIPEDYYIAKLSDIRNYPREDAASLGLILEFEIEYEAEPVRLPFFAPAKLSVDSEQQSSRLAENLRNIGLLESVCDRLGVKDEILSERSKAIASTEEELSDLVDALEDAFEGEQVRVQVEDDRDGDESQVAKLQKLFEEDDGE